MTTCIAENGRVFDDDDVERWAAQAEAGLAGAELTRAQVPWRASGPMETHSLRVPAGLWELVERAARAKGMTVSEYARQALSQSLLSA
ncbi:MULTISPECIES: hypothetical protein [unclassified Actinomyces]|uniref:hypothetical protein n=1 Tax=unclassified Actinomyces TaxID=2609248 RepID=UPI00201832D6|nr:MULTISPECIES: hypothetical protein [unclassified Actinomyces]MCL3777560.1 hypothetical protein [Actinomyces sp. AC-20-1]MCL3790050.1 hypothetical protein [Actinomyces sp. 187325]MCL3791099.1 hypothetical protein [Actinomyces sp. 186855]MCL3794988.1 hypothetical protein [Actinomyces sp. 217892]